MPDTAGAGALIDLLDDRTLEALTLVALADGHLDAPSLADALDRADGEVSNLVGELVRLGLVRRTPDERVIVAHAYVRGAVLERLPAELRRSAHARTASALDHAGAAPALVSAHIEAAADPGLAPRGLQLAAAACRASLMVGEIGAALDALDRIERLAADVGATPAPPAGR